MQNIVILKYNVLLQTPMEDKFAIIVNSLTYILSKFNGNTTGVHKLFKILYFAEQKHLSLYGRDITGDEYHAFQYGPVPTNAYNIVKASRQENVEDLLLNVFSKHFKSRGRNVTALKEIDFDWLSNSEIRCLDESIAENMNLTFDALTTKSHDSAWDEAYPVMYSKNIAQAGGANEDIIEYIVSKEELRNISF
jgi:uncharacterized phage-associated protein